MIARWFEAYVKRDVQLASVCPELRDEAIAYGTALLEANPELVQLYRRVAQGSPEFSYDDPTTYETILAWLIEASAVLEIRASTYVGNRLRR